MKFKHIFFIVCCLCNTFNVNAQRNYEYEIAIHSIYSKFSVNQKSNEFNAKWDAVNANFAALPGIGISAGITKSISSKFNLQFNARWQRWGGTISNRIGNSDIEIIDIYYSSISLPIIFQYALLKKNNLKLLINGGLGADVSYFVRYNFKDYSSQDKAPNQPESTYTPFLLFGTNLELKHKSSSKIKIILGIQITNDQAFNPKRYNDYGGYLGQDIVRLQSTLLSSFLGLKF